MSALQTKQRHIPFRNSTLTYLLHDCLGGDSKALMFCNVSCESVDAKESLQALQFAKRVRSVELGEAKKNSKQLEIYRNKSRQEMDVKNNELSDLRRQLIKSQREIGKLQQTVQLSSLSKESANKQRSELQKMSRESSTFQRKTKEQKTTISRLKHEIGELKKQLSKKNVNFSFTLSLSLFSRNYKNGTPYSLKFEGEPHMLLFMGVKDILGCPESRR